MKRFVFLLIASMFFFTFSSFAQEAPKTEVAKPEATKSETTKSEAAKPAPAQAEPAKTDLPKLALTGWARVRYTMDFTENRPDGFTIPNARFGIKGNITENLSYVFNLEGITNDTENKKMIYDVFVESKLFNFFNLRVGQFKYPFGLEQSTSDQELELITKADCISSIVKPTRDIGFMGLKDFALSSVKFKAFLALLNGSGSNTSDENNGKLVVARLIASPMKGLWIGASYYNGAVAAASDKKERFGFEAKYDDDNFIFRGEFVSGKDKAVKSNGFYATGGYKFLKSWLAMLRYDSYNANRDVTDKEISRITIAVNKYFGKNVMCQLDYEHKTEKPGIKNDVVMGQIQIKY